MKRKQIILLSVISILVLAGVGLRHVWELLSIGAAYKAKVLCSGVFVSQRNAAEVLEGDLAVEDLAILRFIDANLDRTTRSASVNFLGLIRKTAVYRPGLGCTLTFAGYEYPAPVDNATKHKTAGAAAQAPWQVGHSMAKAMEQVDRNLMEAALDWAFSEPDADHLRRTHAVIVIHAGRIVAERYAPGFNRHTPHIGWSMTKSVMHGLVGVLIKEGKLSPADPVDAPEWLDAKDGRHAITVGHLLHMTSGLEFDENYAGPLADVTTMLFRVPDMASYAASKKLVAEPGSQWSYSSGSTNILSRVIRRAVGDPDYLLFPRRALFEAIGMDSAVLEPDASGTFVGSSYMYATAPDWAKFGVLYLRDGIWNGQRILPEGWVAYATTPAPGAPDQAYGAHFWLKIPKEFATGGNASRLPKDAFHAAGYEGQFVSIIPSRDLVVVRLGLTRFASAWQHDTFLCKVLEAVSR